MSLDMHDVKLVPFRFEGGIKFHTSINVTGASLGVNRAGLLGEFSLSHSPAEYLHQAERVSLPNVHTGAKNPLNRRAQGDAKNVTAYCLFS